jgi:hypothetical protein
LNKFLAEKARPGQPNIIKEMSALIGIYNQISELVNQTQKQEPDTQTPERKEANGLPPVIQDVLNEGLLEDTPANGKYLKKGDKKDSRIIEWIFNYSGYSDSLTTALYMQYIITSCKATTIQDYIKRNKETTD